MFDPCSSAEVSKAVAQWLPRHCATIIGQWIAPDLPLSANHVNGYIFQCRHERSTGTTAPRTPCPRQLRHGSRGTLRPTCNRTIGNQNCCNCVRKSMSWTPHRGWSLDTRRKWPSAVMHPRLGVCFCIAVQATGGRLTAIEGALIQLA